MKTMDIIFTEQIIEEGNDSKLKIEFGVKFEFEDEEDLPNIIQQE